MGIDVTKKTFEDSAGSGINSYLAMNNHVELPNRDTSIPIHFNQQRRCIVEKDNSIRASPVCDSSIIPEIEISHYPIKEQKVHTNGIGTKNSIVTESSTKSINQQCKCACHHTHHHHHHHTIVINGNSVAKTIENPASVSTIVPRQSVLKTTSCPAWADGAPKGDRIIKTYDLSLNDDRIGTSYLSQNGNKNNSTTDCDTTVQDWHGDNQIRNHQDYRYSGAKSNQNVSCCPLSKGMIMILGVLCVVIVSLLSGLIYFLVRGNVTTTPPPPTDKNVPIVSTVLNQTSICGKYPAEYLSISTRSVNKDRRTSNLHPPKNDNRINTSQAARIIGGTYANIREYPWQGTSIESMNSDELRDKSRIQARIYGGTPSTSVRFPWQVHLHRISLWVSQRGMVCGGSIILNDWVVTAAHCTATNKDPALWTAYMGMSQISAKMKPPAQRSKIIKIIQHEQYVENWSYDYDISLLKLETPVTFTPSVQPICIPHSTHEYKDGTKCYISGWGATSNSGQVNNPDTLHHAQVDIIGYKTCRRDDWLGSIVSDRMICAGTYDGSRDACQGDSGGPLSCYDPTRKAWTLAGSVSWGFDCGQPKQPGVYTKMTFFVDWIWTEIGKAEQWIPDNDKVELQNDETSDYGSGEGSATNA